MRWSFLAVKIFFDKNWFYKLTVVVPIDNLTFIKNVKNYSESRITFSYMLLLRIDATSNVFISTNNNTS